MQDDKSYIKNMKPVQHMLRDDVEVELVVPFANVYNQGQSLLHLSWPTLPLQSVVINQILISHF